MSYIIREMKVEDLLQVNKIRNYYIKNTTINVALTEKTLEKEYEWFENISNNKFPAIVVEDKEKVVGYSYLAKFRDNDGYKKTVELSIILSPDYKNGGIGTKLLCEIEKRAKSNKYNTIISVITSDNDESIKFHKKNGFNLCGDIKEAAYKNNKYIDIYFMSKKIF